MASSYTAKDILVLRAWSRPPPAGMYIAASTRPACLI